MPTIRPYQPKDHENVRNVCAETGPSEARQEGPVRIMILTSYCDYYAECDPSNSFVIADDNDEAVGYIFCAEDYWDYYKRFKAEYLPRVKGFSLPQRFECWVSAWFPRWFYKKYPAHLHIDILPDYQRMGLGTQLMDNLTGQLRAKGVRGVMLGVGSHNEKGINFYNKYGFTKVVRVPFSTIMGLKL